MQTHRIEMKEGEVYRLTNDRKIEPQNRREKRKAKRDFNKKLKSK